MKSSTKKDELSSGRTKEIKMLNAGNWKIQISFFAFKCKKKEDWKLHVVKLCLASNKERREFAFLQPAYSWEAIFVPAAVEFRNSLSQVYCNWLTSRSNKTWHQILLLNLKHLEWVQKCSELNSNRLFAAIIDSRAINLNQVFRWSEAEVKWSDAFPPISCAEYCFQNKKLVKKLRYR